jgi:hypothetical protein
LYARPIPTSAALTVGACGTVVAVTALDTVAVDVPLALVATTLYVYEVPDAKPVMVNGDRLLAVKLEGLEVAVYELIEAPPVAPPVTVIVVAPLLYGRLVPTSATVITGACGIVVAVMLLDAADAAPVPAELTALAVNV